MEVILEVLFEIIGEVVVELLVEGGFRRVARLLSNRILRAVLGDGNARIRGLPIL